LPEQLHRLHIVHGLHARYAARIREELSARELSM
jgi:phosphotransferase system HPr-like phosphotransfer protein